ncbi:ATP-binding protein [Microscilla marina]|nr:ATP-binding protein [Microscilla marina]
MSLKGRSLCHNHKVNQGCLLVLFFILHTVSTSMAQMPSGSWERVKDLHKGTLVVHYLANQPFIYQDKNTQQLTGIEYDLLQSFTRYLLHQHQVSLTLDFQSAPSLAALYNQIKNTPVDQAVLGVSSFSITPQRIHEVGFTMPYCPDIEVLISNSAVPGVNNVADFQEVMSDFTALYIDQSSLQENLDTIKKLITGLKTEAVPSSDNILQRISTEIDKFGYIELPKYLQGLKQGLKIKRQGVFRVDREGYTMIFPKGSDWVTPLNDYLKSDVFKQKLPVLLEKHLGKDVQELLIKAKTKVSMENNSGILRVEKRLKTLELQKKEIEHKRDRLYIKIFIVGLGFAAIIMALLFRNNWQKQKINSLLQQQKKEIEKQKNDLAEKNEQILQQKEEIEQQRDDVIAKNVEIEQRREELNKLNQVKDRLFSIVSHDLRSPLNSLKGTLALMEMGALAKDEMQYFTGELNKELSYVLELLENLLKWAKAQMEGIEPHFEKINLHALVKSNIGLLQPIADKKQVALINQVAAETTAWGDEEMIKLVVRNLLSNAIKFTKESGTIEVTTKIVENMLEVAIADSGVGISAQQQAQLFNTDTHFSTQGTNHEKGTGLGLLICKEFIEKNNGRIWVESQPDKGSTFKFTLQQKN